MTDRHNRPDFSILVNVHPMQQIPLPPVPTIDAEGKPTMRERGFKIENCGFQVDWLSAEDERVEVNLGAGAGVGSKWMSVRIEDKITGETRYMGIDASVLVNTVMDACGYGERSGT